MDEYENWDDGTLLPEVKARSYEYQRLADLHGPNSFQAREAKRRLLEILDAEAQGQTVIPQDPADEY